jgi:uncharacterized DUF497 family protein
MSEIKFSWDERKNTSNKKKHGLSFQEAVTVFHDENARLIPDPSHSLEEDRFILLGISSKLRVLIVCHCYREKEQLVRIISARKATRQEKQQYEDLSHER